MQSSEFPNVLIISNNCFSYTGNLGRTLSNLFEGWNPDRLAQIYFHDDLPNGKVCHNYFRFSDMDAIKSVVNRKHHGTVMNDWTSCAEDDNDMTTTHGYALARRKNALVRLARESWWLLSHWDSPTLREWLRRISPQVILFAVGDCIFAYRIVNKLARDLNIPVVPFCLDDYLSEPYEHQSVMARRLQSMILKQASATIDRSKFLLTTCKRMSQDYAQKYLRECREIYTVASQPVEPAPVDKTISYFGNISLGRWKSLLAIGQAVKFLGFGGIHIYSGEDLGDTEKWFTEENGIFFHGKISYQEVKEKIAKSTLLLHVESFEKHYAATVRYSISTKIADSLASGVCLFAYGPEDVNSIQYLQQNNAAYVVTEEKSLTDGLREILEDTKRRTDIIRNAVNLAHLNHSKEHNQAVLLEVLKGSVAADPVGVC